MGFMCSSVTGSFFHHFEAITIIYDTCLIINLTDNSR